MERRDHALDVLRGIAVLALIFASLISRSGLPDWMQGSACPWIDGRFTWTAFAFPALVLCMGVSIPHALGRRTPESGSPESWKAWTQVAGWILGRFVALLGLSMAVGHLRSEFYFDRDGMLISLLWFAGMALALVRLPAFFSTATVYALRIVGVCLTVAGLLDQSLTADRYDLGFATLACVGLVGAVVWLITRRAPWMRLALWVGLLGFLAFGDDLTATPILIAPRYLGYLCVLLPGMALGEWAREGLGERFGLAESLGTAQGALGIAGSVYAVLSREFGISVFVLILLGLNALWTLRSSQAHFRVSALGWTGLLAGVMTLGFGAPPGWLWAVATLAGSCFVLAYPLVDFLVALFRRPSRLHVSSEAYTRFASRVRGLSQFTSIRTGYLGLIGENALLGWLMATNVAFPVWKLSGMEQHFQFATPWENVAIAFAQTLMIGLVVSLASRLRVFVRP